MGESIKLIANNKKAYHDYFIEDNYEAGISLHGTEVKSLRMGKCSIKESFIRIENGEVIIYGMHVSPYRKRTFSIKIRFVRGNCCCTVQRSTSWSERLQRRAIRLFLLRVDFRESAKVEIGLAKGKKLYDKRQDIAKRDQRREVEKEFKEKESDF